MTTLTYYVKVVMYKKKSSKVGIMFSYYGVAGANSAIKTQLNARKMSSTRVAQG